MINSISYIHYIMIFQRKLSNSNFEQAISQCHLLQIIMFYRIVMLVVADAIQLNFVEISNRELSVVMSNLLSTE